MAQARAAAGEGEAGKQALGDSGVFQALGRIIFSQPLPPEFVWVKGVDMEAQQIEHEVLLSSKIPHELIETGRGLSRETAIELPKQVTSEMLSLIKDYCLFHLAPGRSDKERKHFNEKFVRMETQRLCHLTSAADALDVQPLVEITSKALARVMEGKSAEEIREAFHLADDLTEEEKLEPLKNTKDDSRIRLLNRLYAKKRKELAEKKASKAMCQASGSQVDNRPLEDLLSFIEDDSEKPSGKGGGGKSNKKKGKAKTKGKQQIADGATSSPAASHSRDVEDHHMLASSGLNCQFEESLLGQLFPEDGFDDDAQLDMEARLFAERLSREWEARVAEHSAVANTRVVPSSGPTSRETETAQQPAVCLTNLIEAESLQFDRDGHGAVSSSMADSVEFTVPFSKRQSSADWDAEPSADHQSASGTTTPAEKPPGRGDLTEGVLDTSGVSCASRMDSLPETAGGSSRIDPQVVEGDKPLPTVSDSDAQVALLALQDYLDSSGLGAHLSIVRKNTAESGAGAMGSASSRKVNNWATETSVHLPSGGVMTLVYQPFNEGR